MPSKYPGWQIRDRLASNFRFTLLDHLGVIPFIHQGVVFAYLDRKELSRERAVSASGSDPLRTIQGGDEYWLIAHPVFEVRTFYKHGDVVTEPFPRYGDDESPLIEYAYHKVTNSDRDRPQVLSISGSFKLGKSVFGGIIPASFAICPNLEWDFWGMEYDITMPEMTYMLRALVDEKGGILPHVKEDTGDELVGWQRYKLGPSMGRMYLDLSNGARFRARSVRRTIESDSDPMKGKEMDGFSVCEAYQYPNIQTLLEYRQNLSVRRGYYIVPSTPDRPIMDEISTRCDPDNDEFPNWLGVSEIHRRENPYAFSVSDYFEDLKTFSREKFSVYWEGKSGAWMGSVYPEPQYFDTTTHPEFWHDPNGEPTPENFAPPGWLKRRCGMDTGTYRGAASALCDDDGNIYFIGSFCNYRYVAGKIDLDEEATIPGDCAKVKDFHSKIGGRWQYFCDPNSQFKSEYRAQGGIILRKGKRDPERRCEVTRGMAQNGFIWFAPWLKDSELVYEWKSAKYPDKGSSTKVSKRVDGDDHVLDSAEHIAAMHPRAPKQPDDTPPTLIESMRVKSPTGRDYDPVLGH